MTIGTCLVAFYIPVGPGSILIKYFFHFGFHYRIFDTVLKLKLNTYSILSVLDFVDSLTTR